MADRSKKREGQIQKLEYLKNEKSYLDEIKSIFHSFWKAIIWWKNKHLMKIPETNFNSLFGAYWALETGRKSNVHKTFRRRPGHLLIHVQFTVLCSGKWIRFWGLIVLLLLLILLLCFKNIRTVAVPTENKLTYNKPVLIARGFINHI